MPVPAQGPDETVRFFVTYSGIRPPVSLVEPLEAAALQHRNTYVRAVYDASDRLVRFDKLVYGASELTHVYEWSDDGRLAVATLTIDGEVNVLRFDPVDAEG